MENGHLELKPVRLAPNVAVTIQPGQTLELRGEVQDSSLTNGNATEIQIFPRQNLPAGLNIVKCECTNDKQVIIHLQNVRSQSVSLTSNIILAELDAKLEIDALVGPSCEIKVCINNIETSALLDSGSQVTVIAEHFYKTYLSHLPLRDLNFPFTVTGAGGHDVPYLGVTLIDCKLPDSVVGHGNSSCEVAALVCKDTNFSKQIPVIIGTNVFRSFKPGTMHQEKLKCEAVFALNMQARLDIEKGKLGNILVKDQSVIVPAHSSKLVKGLPKLKTKIPALTHVLVQEPSDQELPSGLGIVASKVEMNGLRKIKVELINSTDHDIVLKRKDILADIFVIYAEYDLNKVINLIHTDDVNVLNETKRMCESEPKLNEKTEFHFGPDTPDDWKKSFSKKLQAYSDVFIKHEYDLGKTSEVLHDIILEPGPYIRERARPIPPQDLEEVKHHIQEMLDAKIISPSCSPYASPIVLVRKKNGSLRICVDYRKVNARTVKDSYPLPIIEELFTTLHGAKYFSSVDLCKAYYQVEMTERAKQLSAFIGPFGLYQFERMAMGLKNAPHTFQRLMEKFFQT